MQLCIVVIFVILLSGLQEQNSMELSFFNLNEEAFFVKNYPELRKFWSFEVG